MEMDRGRFISDNSIQDYTEVQIRMAQQDLDQYRHTLELEWMRKD